MQINCLLPPFNRHAYCRLAYVKFFSQNALVHTYLARAQTTYDTARPPRPVYIYPAKGLVHTLNPLNEPHVQPCQNHIPRYQCLNHCFYLFCLSKGPSKYLLQQSDAELKAPSALLSR